MSYFRILSLALLTGLPTVFFSQETESGPSVKKLHLKKINYISVNGRFGYGLSSSELQQDNNWSYAGGQALLMGAGFNYIIKNNVGFDLQINHERGKNNYKNSGVSLKTGYNTLGAELGVKKLVLTRPDDTFFIRGGFGVNFLVNTGDSFINEFYAYRTSAGSIPNLYAMPELGYQFRFGNPNHIIDLSVLYKYSLSTVANSEMSFFIDNTTTESNSATLSGTYFGFALRYSYMINAFRKKNDTRSTPDSIF